MSKSNYLEDAILDHVLGADVLTPPATVYVSLHSADPGDTGASELVGDGYERVAVTNNDTNWPAASGGVKSNGTAISFAAADGADWAEATHFGIWDAATVGNPLYLGELTTPKTVSDGDTASFAAGTLDVTEN